MEAVSRIGEWMNEGGDLLSNIVENPNSNGKYKCILMVVLSERDGEYQFSRVDRQGWFTDFKIYLYKGKKGNSTDATPTCKITEMEKTFKKKFLRWFDNCEDYPLSEKEKESLKKMGMAIEANKEKILADLQENFSSRKSGENGIITLGIENNDKPKYLMEIPLFRNLLLNKGSEIFSRKYGVESIGKDAKCSVCGETKEEVYGFAIPWAFHTFDKPGFIAGGFEVSESWKDTPVCCECAKNLEVGKKYIEEKLDFSFYGFRYLLVPKLALGRDVEAVLRILGAKSQKRKLKLNNEVGRRITDDEDEILELVGNEKDFLSNNLIFYKKDQSSYRILLSIEGILPSRFAKIFKLKEVIDKKFEIYNNLCFSEAQKEKTI